MDFHIKYITPDIKLSTYDDKLFKTETVFEFHMLVWFISGETKIIQADTSYLFKAGDIFPDPCEIIWQRLLITLKTGSRTKLW
ncbi:hypothetical protein [Chryseobacterium wanjuense]